MKFTLYWDEKKIIVQCSHNNGLQNYPLTEALNGLLNKKSSIFGWSPTLVSYNIIDTWCFFYKTGINILLKLKKFDIFIKVWKYFLLGKKVFVEIIFLFVSIFIFILNNTLVRKLLNGFFFFCNWISRYFQ